MLRSPADVEQDARLDFDLCVVGAGAGGIAMAHRLASSGLAVALLEAGGFERPEVGPDHPYRGENVGRKYSLTSTRLRYFGGTTNHWGGWCRPLDALDFAPRPRVRRSSWPFGPEELAPYYVVAARYCQIEPHPFDRDWLPTPGRHAEVFFGRHDSDFVEKEFRFSPPTHFGEVYLPELRASPTLHCFTDSTAAEIHVESGRVDRLEIRAPGGKRFFVRAGAFALTMGAIENARLLLHSDRTVRGGVGNESGWVGRCFGDHPGWTIGRLQTRLPLPYAEYRTAGSLHLPHLSLRDDLLEELGMVNLGIMCLPLRGRVDLPIESVEDLEAAVEEASRVDPQAAVEEAGRVDRETGEPLPPQREWAQFHRVLARLESVPNPQSRVTLGRDRDPFGVRRVRLDWELDGIELETLDKLADLLGRRVGAHDLGRFHRTFWDGAAGRGAQLFYQSHQLGTTRMSADPDAGVVDADGRVHTVANLYLTGGSVFPTFGFTNPTLTVVALAVRLADHLVAVSRGG